MSTCYGVDFTATMQWPYLDCGQPGFEKFMEGLDIVFDGEVTAQIGYNQADPAYVTDGYEMDADTYSGVGMIPFPCAARSFSLILTWGTDLAWVWYSGNLYVGTGDSP